MVKWIGAMTRLRKSLALLRAKMWPKLRIFLIVALAVSMAEFVAFDVGMILAADIMLYIELILGAWALTLLARFMPGISISLFIFQSKMFASGEDVEADEIEEAEILK